MPQGKRCKRANRRGRSFTPHGRRPDRSKAAPSVVVLKAVEGMEGLRRVARSFCMLHVDECELEAKRSRLQNVDEIDRWEEVRWGDEWGRRGAEAKSIKGR